MVCVSLDYYWFKQWLIEACDGFQIICFILWNFRNVDQIWTFPPLLLCRNASIYIRRIWKHPLEIFFHIWTFLELQHFQSVWHYRASQMRNSFLVFLNLVFKNGGFLICHGNLKIKTWKMRSPIYENISNGLLNQKFVWMNINFLTNSFGFLVSPNQ